MNATPHVVLTPTDVLAHEVHALLCDRSPEVLSFSDIAVAAHASPRDTRAALDRLLDLSRITSTADGNFALAPGGHR